MGIDARSILDLWLRRLLLRSPLSKNDVDAIRALPGAFDTIRPNHDFVRLGECVTASCLVVDGLAARFGQTRKGGRTLTALHIPGDAADLHSFVLPKADGALTALSHLTIYRIPHDALREISERSPVIARALWRDCTVDASIAFKWLVSVGRQHALERTAHLLCELAMRYAAIGYSRSKFPWNMTQQHLGDALALTAVHVNRMLRQLREKTGIEIKDHMLAISDWETLAQIGDFDPSYLHTGCNQV